MKLLNTLSIVTGILTGVWNMPVPASAADLPRQMLQPVAPMVPAVPFVWSGAYVGGIVGYGWGAFNEDSGFGSTGINADGVKGGGFVGFRYQFAGTNVVIGLEGDLLASAQSGSFTTQVGTVCTGGRHPVCSPVYGTNTINLPYQGDVDFTIGYAFDRFLPYVGAGTSYGTATDAGGDALRGWGYNVIVGVDYVPAILGDHLGFGVFYRYAHMNGTDSGPASTSFDDNFFGARAFYRLPN